MAERCCFKTQNHDRVNDLLLSRSSVGVSDSIKKTYSATYFDCITMYCWRVVGTNNCADKQPGQYYIIFEDPKSLNESLGCTCVYIALRRLDYKFFKSSYYKTSLCSLELDMSFMQGLYATNLWKVCSVCFTMKRILQLCRWCSKLVSYCVQSFIDE